MVQIVHSNRIDVHPTSVAVEHEVEEFMEYGTRISDGVAQVIASWWHSPGRPYSTRLSTMGQVLNDMTISDFVSEAEFNAASEFDQDCLEALEDYIEYWKNAAQ